MVVAGIKLEDKRSTVPFLQRQLNIDNNKRKIELKRLQFVGDQKRKYCYLNFFVRVNYVFFWIWKIKHTLLLLYLEYI